MDINEAIQKIVEESSVPLVMRYDEGSSEWQNYPEMNRWFVTAQQKYANDTLLARGHLFLNDVFRMLGFEQTAFGALVGWVADDDLGFAINFGIMEIPNSVDLELAFNHHGIIIHKLEENN